MFAAPYRRMYIIYIVMLYIKLKHLQNSFKCSRSGVYSYIGFNVTGWVTYCRTPKNWAQTEHHNHYQCMLGTSVMSANYEILCLRSFKVQL